MRGGGKRGRGIDANTLPILCNSGNLQSFTNPFRHDLGRASKQSRLDVLRNADVKTPIVRPRVIGNSLIPLPACGGCLRRQAVEEGERVGRVPEGR